MPENPESARLQEASTLETMRFQQSGPGKKPWRKWGPYLSERQWGTVREDYSGGGDAWNYFAHDQARSRVYHWGEDGLAGISDCDQLLCFSVALWNGKDPILKERMFGLTNSEGNHGEDVKEYYFYLDRTPTHSYMKYLYKHPQAAFPYKNLIETNKRRNRGDIEYELLDTGIFNDDRYFDVFVEYAKQSPEDILIQIRVSNRGPEPATVDVLPTLWFRNTWTWWPDTPKPPLKQVSGQKGVKTVAASHAKLGERYLYCEGDVPLLFTENETNNKRVFGTPNPTSYVKDGINNYVVQGNRNAALVNGDRLCRILSRMLDENEFLSPYEIRALSRYHADHPYVVRVEDQEYRVNYLPAESDTGMFGGNSNWRGPIWMPVNVLLIRALLSFYLYYGGNFKIECPTGSGKLMNLFEVAQEIANRLERIFLRDKSGRRPVYGVQRNSRPIPNGRITYCSTSTSTAITARAWEPASRPDGLATCQN